MLQDALLAWLHYLAIFILIVLMTAQAVLLRPGMAAQSVAGWRSMTACIWRARWPCWRRASCA